MKERFTPTPVGNTLSKNRYGSQSAVYIALWLKSKRAGDQTCPFCGV